MADISISPLAPREFRVQVREGNRETTHQVTVPERLGEGVELRDDDLERVVRESFRFLLEHERATSILAQFSLSDISRYFPEYQGNSHAASPEPATSPVDSGLLTTPLSQDLRDEDDQCAPDREQQLVDAFGDQPASWQRLGGRLHGQHQDRRAKDHPGDQSYRRMR